MEAIPLSRLPTGQRAAVIKLNCSEALCRRLEDLGMMEGTELRCLHRSSAGSPAAYELRGAVIALRREDAAEIFIEVQP